MTTTMHPDPTGHRSPVTHTPDPLTEAWADLDAKLVLEADEHLSGAYGGLLPGDVALAIELERGQEYDPGGYDALACLSVHGDLAVEALKNPSHHEVAMLVTLAYELLDALRDGLLDLEAARPSHLAWAVVEPPSMLFGTLPKAR